MPIIKFTAADVLRNKVLDAGFYGASIVKCSDWKVAKSGTSQNMIVTFKIDNTDGKEIEINFNTAAISRMIPLISSACGVDVKPEDFNFNTDDLMGKQVDVEVVHREFDGRISNDIATYVPYGRSKTAAQY